MNQEKAVKITLTGKVSYTDHITVIQAAQILAMIENEESQQQISSGGGTVPPGAGRRPLIGGATVNSAVQNPRAALDKSGAKTNPERIVALALYLHDADGLETVKPDDIKSLFKRAREATPKNFSRDLGEAVRAGWLDGDDAEGYYVTQKAQGVLDSGFEALRVSRTSSRSSGNGRGGSKQSTTPDVFAQVDEIEPQMDGVIGYHKVKKRTQKVLWALAKAKELGVASVTGKDLSWLTDRLGDGVSVSDMTANYRSLNRAGLANKSLQTKQMRITPDGEAHLKTLLAE